jgi:hypothetical protein
MFGSAVRALWCSCCMALATREICGHLSPKHWSNTTLSSFLISVAAILDKLGVQELALVTHDIGNMVRLRLCGALSRACDEMGSDGRFPPRHRSLGRPAENPKV